MGLKYSVGDPLVTVLVGRGGGGGGGGITENDQLSNACEKLFGWQKVK